MLLSLCCAKGAPGVTTVASTMGAVWPRTRRVIVAECDPSGGALAARFGLSPRLGMTGLALSGRKEAKGAEALSSHVQRLPGGLEVLAGPVSADAALALDRELGGQGAKVFPLGIDVIADCGRLLPDAPGQTAMLQTADVVLFLLRPDVSGLAHAFSAFRRLRSNAPNPRALLVVVGRGPFAVAEVQETLDAEVAGVVPIDKEAAALASGEPGNPRRFARSRLVASVRRIVDQVTLGLQDGEQVASGPVASQAEPDTRVAATPK